MIKRFLRWLNTSTCKHPNNHKSWIAHNDGSWSIGCMRCGEVLQP